MVGEEDMPKVVDFASQKNIIAEAAWRVIQRNGIGKASVRKIAKEAGISSGALQHYFGSQSELLEFAMKLVVDHATYRIRVINKAPSITLPDAVEILLNLLPVNREQEMEMEVWLSMTVKAFHEPSLDEISKNTYRMIYQTILTVLKQLEEAHLLKLGLDLEHEAKRLHVLVDGLSIHRMICPEMMPAEQIRSILHQHIRELSVLEAL